MLFLYLVNVTYKILNKNSIIEIFFSNVKTPRRISDCILYALAQPYLYLQQRICRKNTFVLEDFPINFYIFIL